MSVKAIEKLIFDYACYIDAGKFAALAELFRHGRICSAAGEPTVGYDAVLALYRKTTRRYADGTPRTRHLTTNLQVELHGDRANSRSYFTVMQAVEDFPLQPIISGSYEDAFERVDRHWRFTCRTIAPDLLGDLSRHLLIDISKFAQH